MKYVALLRGVNVGVKNALAMKDLKAICEKLGYKEVKTILASGNVVFETSQKSEKVEAALSAALGKKMSRPILVMVRSIDWLKKLEASNPFKGIKVTPKTRLYVTFLSEKPKSKKIVTSHPSYKILKVTDTEMFSHLEIQDGVQTPDLMKVIDQSLGKKTTMRNWNTVQKILKA